MGLRTRRQREKREDDFFYIKRKRFGSLRFCKKNIPRLIEREIGPVRQQQNRGDEDMSVEGRNSEGYPDPTAEAAIQSICNGQDTGSAFGFMPVVYICSPYRGDTEGNTRKAQRYSRYAVEHGYIPIAPHLLLPQFVSEETERELALFMGMVLLSKCKELWVCGDTVSEGMTAEIAKAETRNMEIKYFKEEMFT